MKTAFIVCSRSKSNRLPRKALRHVNGEALILNLSLRLTDCGHPVIIAVPKEDYDEYYSIFEGFKDIHVYEGSAETDHDPLGRMYEAAKEFKVENIVRVTHDKVFVEPELVSAALSNYLHGGYNYVYSSQFCDGSAFEIIRFNVLEEAAKRFKNVEYIGYAIRAVTENVLHFTVPPKYRSRARFLVDYPEDLLVLEYVFSKIGNYCYLEDAIQLVNEKPFLSFLNKLPDITIYTCAKNAEKYINQAMQSVASQSMFKWSEYILIDDGSSDSTLDLMLNFKVMHDNVRVVKNYNNIGLAASSNVALQKAKGKYIIRLDADDHFTDYSSLTKLFHMMEVDNVEAVYPDYYDGSLCTINAGENSHHPAGAMFNTRALNHIRFNDKLKHFDGLDLYERAKDSLKISYLKEPTFFYRHTPGSMSRSNLEEREVVRKQIMDNSMKASLF